MRYTYDEDGWYDVDPEERLGPLAHYDCHECKTRNPWGECRCRSTSIEPCQSCDWYGFHDCEPEEEDE